MGMKSALFRNELDASSGYIQKQNLNKAPRMELDIGST